MYKTSHENVFWNSSLAETIIGRFRDSITDNNGGGAVRRMSVGTSRKDDKLDYLVTFEGGLRSKYNDNSK